MFLKEFEIENSRLRHTKQQSKVYQLMPTAAPCPSLSVRNLPIVQNLKQHPNQIVLEIEFSIAEPDYPPIKTSLPPVT
jgi:hypothetical protein